MNLTENEQYHQLQAPTKSFEMDQTLVGDNAGFNRIFQFKTAKQ